MRFRLLVCSISFLLGANQLFGAIITSTGAGGNWSAGGSWVGGVVPVAADDVIIVSGATISVDVNSACLSLTLNGTAILDFPTNTRTLTVNGTMTMNGTSQVTGNNNNRILSLLGDFNIPAGQTGSVGGVRISQAIGATFNLAGNFVPTDNTGIKTFGNANFFDGCFLDAGVTEAIIIVGNLAVLPGAPGMHAQIGRITMSVLGTTTVSGYLEFRNSNAGIKTFSNTITVAPGATWDNIVGEDPVINCSIVNNGLWPIPTGGNGRYDVTNGVGVYTYSGSDEIGMTRLRILNGASVTNTGILRVTRTGSQGLTVTGGSTFINGTNGYLKLQSSPVPVDVTGSVVDFSPVNNTVEYLSLVAQTIHPTTYYNLIGSGDNTKTVNGATVVNGGSLTIQGTTFVDVTGGTDLTGTGNLIMNGTSSLQISSAGTVPALTGGAHVLGAGTTIWFNRAGPQTAASSASYPYRNLTINGNAGSALNMSAVTVVEENLTLLVSGTMTNNVALTVNGDFNHISTAASTLTGNLSVSNFLASNGTITYSGHTITIFGDDGTWTNNGCAFVTDGTSVVAFVTGTNQTITGLFATTFATLSINNPNGVTLARDETVSGFLTFGTGSGNLFTDTHIITLTSLAANVTRTAPNPGFVEGNLKKSASAGFPNPTFEVGTGTSYAPLNTTFTGIAGTGDITVSTSGSDSPEIFSALIQPDQSINRTWSVTNNTLTFTTVDMTHNFVPSPGGDPDASTDVTNGSLMVIKGFNNTTLTWFATQVVTPPVFNLNSFVHFGLPMADLPAGQQVDFQGGETINPTFVFNRITGAGLLWSSQATWIQVRSGIISVDMAGNVTGTLTNFSGPDAELADGDQVMLLSTPGTVYTVVPGSRINDVTMQIAPPPVGVITNAPFGRQYVPGINSPVSDVDAVSIANTNIAPDVATSVTLDVTAQILVLNIGSTSRITAHSLTHQNSTRTLTVLANATVSQPGASVTNDWNINDATANVSGDVTIGTGTNNTLARVSRINITTGTLGAGNLRFRPFNSGGRHVQTVLNLTGAGTVNLHGALTFNGNRGTLNSAVGSTFNFDRTASSQSIIIPVSSAAAWVYHNIHANNTSAAGVAFSFTSTATSVTGNVRVQSGKMTLINLNIVGDPARTFEVANGAAFEMTSASNAGVGAFPSGFGTITLGATSTVAYNQSGNTNPWPVTATTYGNLIIGQGISVRNFQLANATTTVLGDLTIGTGVTTPDLLGNTASVLNVTGNLLINTGSVLNATNIADINLGGNWTDNGAFTQATNRVTFNSPAANVLQTIGGSVAETFYNLTLNTSAATDIVRLSSTTHITNDLILTQGELDLNSNTLFIDRSAPGAVTRTTGYIKSEDIAAPNGTISWFIDNTTGMYQYPFGKSSTEYIPLIFNVTVAGAKGAGTGYVGASTYATAATNPPGEFPPTVTNLNGTTGGASVTDRYWVITLGSPEYTGTRPTATVTFTAVNTEKPTTWTAIGEPPTNPNSLLAQRWSPANTWDPAQTSPVQTYANNSPAAGTFQVGVPGLTSFSPWTITDSSVPLPIELVDFTAKLRGSLVEISWETETELNNDYFLVQKSRDAEEFVDVISIKGGGTTTTPKSYSVVDNQPASGTWYYRLKQMDFDGQFSYSKLVAIEVPESSIWNIYPNPSNGTELTIALSSSSVGKTASVIIQDVSGKELLRLSTEQLESPELKIEVPTKLSSGLYLITIVVDQQVSRQKLIVH